MRDLSIFLLKISLAAKMRKGFRNFCNGDASTATLDQQKLDPYNLESNTQGERHATLEEMIKQLDLEEKMARREKLDDDDDDDRVIPHRMSCVNSSDILRTARNALNQYPRFSLDGKDSMYRSSFQNLASASRKSISRNHGSNIEAERTRRLPSKLAGERVIWCKPGAVAKLMGLEAMPIPVKRQNIRRKTERHENFGNDLRREIKGSCSRTGYCFMKPVAVELPNGELGWPIRRFH